MIFAAGLDGFRPVDLLQHHNPGQMVGEGHESHGKLKICGGLDLGGNAKGRADQKADAAFSAELDRCQLFGKAFTAQLLTLRGEDAKVSPFGNFLENGFRFLIQSCRDFSRGGVLR